MNEKDVGHLFQEEPIDYNQFREVSATVEALSKDSILKLEKVKCPEIGMAGAVAHWGQKYPKEEIDSIIGAEFGQDKVAKDTGFDELWRVPESYTPKEIFAEEMEVVQRLVFSALELNGWESGQVDALFFGGSPLILHDYGEAIAQTTGLTHLDPQKEIFNYYLYCNAGGHGLRKALTNPDLEGKKVLVLAVEGLTRQMREFNPQKTDPLSPQFFSDGAAVIGVVPNKNLAYLLGEFKEVKDGGALAAVEPYRDLIDPEDELIQEIGNIKLIRLPQPPAGMQINMRPRETTRLFLRNVGEVGENVYGQHNKKYPEKEIRFAIAHHASAKIIQGLERRLGIPIPWVVKDGNSSGATTLIAFVRLMEKFKPGDHVMVVSFGAGISIDVFVVKIGGRGESF